VLFLVESRVPVLEISPQTELVETVSGKAVQFGSVGRAEQRLVEREDPLLCPLSDFHRFGSSDAAANTPLRKYFVRDGH